MTYMIKYNFLPKMYINLNFFFEFFLIELHFDDDFGFLFQAHDL
jgi:hypothetical protein